MLRFTLALALFATPALAQDGAKLFDQRCKVCHGAASSAMGPSLKGVYGAKIASRPGFKYSPAMTAKGAAASWDEASLDAYLKSPMVFAPGSRMPISVPAAAERAALVAHLKTLK